MSLPLPELESYWARLGASSPAVQTLEGAGTHPHFDEPKARPVAAVVPLTPKSFGPS